MTFWTNLNALLQTCGEGEIDSAMKPAIIEILGENWEDIPGANCEKTYPYKIKRAQDEPMKWEAPILSFKLERHGGTVMGSKKAEIHSWVIDTQKRRAQIVNKSPRYLVPPDRKWDPTPLAQELFRAIAQRQEHPNLKWDNENTTVRLIGIRDLIPGDNNQTLQGRRKKFRENLQELLSEKGWTMDSRYKIEAE